MLVELVANRDRAANVRLDGRHAGRRRRDVLAQDALVHEDAANHGGGCCAVGGHLENGALSEKPAANAVLRLVEDHFLQAPARREFRVHFNFIVTRQSPVQKGEVGIHKAIDAEVGLDQLGQVGARFLEHRFLQDGIEGLELATVRRGEIDLLQTEPLIAEAGDKSIELLVGDHAVDLFGDLAGLAEFALIRQLRKRPIGHADPESVAQARGNGMVVQLAGRLDKGQESRRAKNRPVACVQRLGGGFAFRERLTRDPAIGGKLLSRHRPPECPSRETRHHLVQRGSGIGFRLVEIDVAKEVSAQGGAVGVGINSLDDNAAIRNSRVAIFLQVASRERNVAAFRAGSWAAQFEIVGLELQLVTALNPRLVDQIPRLRSGFDQADHVENWRTGGAGARTQRAPHRAVLAGVDGVNVAQRDAIPAVVSNLRHGHSPKKLQRHGPGDALSLA